jgi:zinc transport system substrate-binding protein
MFKNNQKKIILAAFLLIILLTVLFFWFYRHYRLTSAKLAPLTDSQGRLIVTASSFPVYDFAREVGGDRVTVSLILPPGAEAHSFRPTGKELAMINNSGLFLYTSAIMEPWAPALTKKTSSATRIAAVADGLADASGDPHVWLDFSKAQAMVRNIAAAYQAADPSGYSYYQKRAVDYNEKLIALDKKFASGLSDCQFKEFISGGHYAFGYLAKRYGLGYEAAQGFVPDTTPAGVDIPRLLHLVQELKDKKEPYVYYEELIMPSLGEMLRQASGARLMPLNSAHNVARYDLSSGVTFLKLMEADLQTLRLGLNCR